MRRVELEHVLRAASRVLGERDLLVIGSASILGTFPETALPATATRSDEADEAAGPAPSPDPARVVPVPGCTGIDRVTAR